MDKFVKESQKKSNEQYLKELKEVICTTDIEIKCFNDLEEGEPLPWISKWVLNNLNMLYSDKLLTRRPTKVEAYLEKYPDGREPKLVVKYILK